MNNELSRTLVQFDLEGFEVMEEAQQLLQDLNRKVLENRERRAERYGLEIKANLFL